MQASSNLALSVSAVMCFALCGCEKLTAIADAAREAGANKVELVAMRAELSQVKARLLTLEGVQDKRLAETNARLADLELVQTKSEKTQEAHTLPADEIPALKTAISLCVQQVHSAPEAKGGKDLFSDAKFWTDFDAFYNPANGRVENNNLYNGGVPAVFFFKKCMTTQGFPLK